MGDTSRLGGTARGQRWWRPGQTGDTDGRSGLEGHCQWGSGDIARLGGRGALPGWGTLPDWGLGGHIQTGVHCWGGFRVGGHCQSWGDTVRLWDDARGMGGVCHCQTGGHCCGIREGSRDGGHCLNGGHHQRVMEGGHCQTGDAASRSGSGGHIQSGGHWQGWGDKRSPAFPQLRSHHPPTFLCVPVCPPPPAACPTRG